MSLSIKIFLGLFSIFLVVLLARINWEQGLFSDQNLVSFFAIVACVFGIFTSLIINLLHTINKANKAKQI